MSRNNTTLIRRQLLIRVASLYLDGTLVTALDRVPLELRPKTYQGQRVRCCLPMERAILRYRLMAMLGFAIEDETDELKTLGAYAQEALERQGRDPRLLTVIDEACSACVKGTHFVTNACRGCMAQSCLLNCPRKAITMVGGRSQIDGELCVNCGRCQALCPYHAILRIPIPCEEGCPVKAITRGESGKQVIDHDRCIQCGNCLEACPFGAVVEPSELVGALGALVGPKPTVALFAPALAGQFDASLEQLVGAMLALGFDHVLEVAAGADRTTALEAEELVERLEAGATFMTTSCCPAYTAFVAKHLPALGSAVSSTPSPMVLTAQEAAARYPDSVRMFISPCVAKRREALGSPLVDFVLSFEELGAAFVAKGIEVAQCAPSAPGVAASAAGRGYAMSGGVREAVAGHLGDRVDLRPDLISGLDKEAVRRLRVYAAGNGPGNFVEAMSCEGGCVNGPCVLAEPKLARRRLGVKA